MNTLQTNHTIDGNIVQKSGKTLDNYDIYERDNGNDTVLYFVHRKTNKVCFKMDIEADMSQGIGFVDSWDIQSVK